MTDWAGVSAASVFHASTAGPRPGSAGDRQDLPVRDALLPALLEHATDVLERADVSSGSVAAWGCLVATEAATHSTAEAIAATLVELGPRWVDPDTFLYYSPQTIAADLCIRLGLGGPSMTLIGPSSGVDVLGLGARWTRTGRCPGALIVAVDRQVPGAPAADGRKAVPEEWSVGIAVVTADHGALRIGEWRPAGARDADGLGTPRSPAPGTHASPRAVEPFARLAGWLDAGGPDGTAALGSHGSEVAVGPRDAQEPAC
ncbi:hypothetical protein [Streptomyces sp. NPDC060022]|uniref:hypothetical protein n=1 Tax=Streptomyces sp. NPDC060022 TaxID=3347039 RepID=UPI0036AA3B78